MAKKKRYAKRGVQHVDVDWYGDDFDRIVEEHGDAALYAAGNVVQTAAERRAPRRTGKLHSSGYVLSGRYSSYVKRRYWRNLKRPPEGGATVGFSAPHAHLIEGGRRKAGAILPRRKKALAWGGQFRSRSKFKRQSSKPFLGPAIEETKTTMVEGMAEVLRAALESGLPV